MRKGSIALTPVIVSFFSVAAFLAVMYFALPKNNTNNNANTNSGNLNANTSLGVPAPGFENVNEMVVGNTNSDEPTATNTNTATDPTAGWKTYTNNVWGISFQYPSEWAIQSDTLTSSVVAEGGGALTLTVGGTANTRPMFWMELNPLGHGGPPAQRFYDLQILTDGHVQLTNERQSCESFEENICDGEVFWISASLNVDEGRITGYLNFVSDSTRIPDPTWTSIVETILDTFVITQ